MKKRHIILVVIGSLLVLFFTFFTIAIAPIATGYPAKYMCSSVYVNTMNPIPCGLITSNLKTQYSGWWDYSIDDDSKTVEVELYGLILPSKAKFVDGCGCALIGDKSDMADNEIIRDVPINTQMDTLEWPLGSSTAALCGKNKLKQDKLMARLENEFVEVPNAPRKYTWGVAVAYKDQLWAEDIWRV